MNVVHCPEIKFAENDAANGVASEAAEELANSITHGAGLLLSIVGGCALLLAADGRVNGTVFAGCAIYSLTLVALYLASTLSHVFHRSPRKRLLRMLDQGCIYLLIAGSFTPFALAYLASGGWLLLLATMWVIAIAGFVSKMVWAHRVDSVSMWVYLALGWMPILAARPIVSAVPLECLFWIMAGGLSYTIGTVFLTLDERVPYFHAVWHLFVIAGSICHYVVISQFVVPGAA